MSDSYMSVPPTLEDAAVAEQLVRDGEARFDARLNETADAICRCCVEEGVQILRLSGPTCAGKTTTAAKLTAALEAVGRTVYPISLDDFFYDCDILREFAKVDPEGKLDYDSVEALDLDTLRTSIRSLLETGRTEIPLFDFTSGMRTSVRVLDVREHPEESPVFLFEGIQAVYPEVVAMFDGIANKSIFISVQRGLRVGAVTFEPQEIRLMRRLVRDEAKRGTDPAFTLRLWTSVRANEIHAILPYADGCDFTIDSAMPFDAHMLAPHLRRIMSEHPVDGEEATAAKRLLGKLDGIEGISETLLSPDSLYHEFILT